MTEITITIPPIEIPTTTPADENIQEIAEAVSSGVMARDVNGEWYCIGKQVADFGWMQEDVAASGDDLDDPKIKAALEAAIEAMS